MIKKINHWFNNTNLLFQLAISILSMLCFSLIAGFLLSDSMHRIFIDLSSVYNIKPTYITAIWVLALRYGPFLSCIVMLIVFFVKPVDPIVKSKECVE